VKNVTMALRIEVQPWVAVYVALMLRHSRSDKFKATLSTFVIDHGVKALPL
jgi:hypothetical protein